MHASETRHPGYNLLDCLRCTVEVDHSLVYPHLVPVPRLGALSAGGLAGGDLEDLGGHPNRTLHLQLGLLSTSDQVTTD